MRTVTFDFERIGTIDDFYALATSALPLPEYFGNNLDALWDSITGAVALPVEVRFTNLSLNQLETFHTLITLMEEAANELGDDFIFTYFLQKG